MRRIPLHNRKGEVVAHALVDDEDAHLGRYRWHRNNGYAVRFVGRKRRVMHREVLRLDPGDPLTCDHINRDRLDNRRANLRAVTQAQNQQNRGSMPGSSSRFRGVSWIATEGKWRAQVMLGRKNHTVGRFDSEDAAARAAAAFRAEHMPYSTEAA